MFTVCIEMYRIFLKKALLPLCLLLRCFRKLKAMAFRHTKWTVRALFITTALSEWLHANYSCFFWWQWEAVERIESRAWPWYFKAAGG